MLVLSRHSEESIMFGDDIEVKVTKIRGGNVHLSIRAPLKYNIMRGENYEQYNNDFKKLVNNQNYDDALELLDETPRYTPTSDLAVKCRDGLESEGKLTEERRRKLEQYIND